VLVVPRIHNEIIYFDKITSVKGWLDFTKWQLLEWFNWHWAPSPDSRQTGQSDFNKMWYLIMESIKWPQRRSSIICIFSSNATKNTISSSANNDLMQLIMAYEENVSLLAHRVSGNGIFLLYAAVISRMATSALKESSLWCKDHCSVCERFGFGSLGNQRHR
jgi:hypothetical protein